MAFNYLKDINKKNIMVMVAGKKGGNLQSTLENMNTSMPKIRLTWLLDKIMAYTFKKSN